MMWMVPRIVHERTISRRSNAASTSRTEGEPCVREAIAQRPPQNSCACVASMCEAASATVLAGALSRWDCSRRSRMREELTVPLWRAARTPRIRTQPPIAAAAPDRLALYVRIASACRVHVGQVDLGCEARSSRAPEGSERVRGQRVLRLQVLVDALGAALAAETRHLPAAEGRSGVRHHPHVEAHHAGLEPLDHAL